jgi:carbonic anhydrase
VTFHWDPVPLSVVNTGHAVQVEDSARSSLVVDGVRYALVQLHFHTPAEHTIEGRGFDAELHLVHRSPDGKIAVVAVLFRAGAENAVLAPLVLAAPTRPGPAVVVQDKSLDLEALMPRAPRFASYDGSLTAPPCAEGVRWLVVSPEVEPPELSPVQLDALRAAMHAPTNRPVQARNGREVGVRVGAASDAR